MKTFVVLILLLCIPYVLSAQNSSDSTQKITVDGYVEAYYQYDFNQPANNTRPGFVYSHNRHNEFNVNLGLIRGNYQNDRIRAHLGLAVGTYMNANYAAEPGVLKNIYEANAGIKLSKTKDVWIDAGIFSSHIGYESAIGKDNWILTRSITADNSPYYLSGVKITYNTPNEKWLLSALAVNGWQQIQRSNNNSRIALGTQIQFKPSESLTFNSSTYIGAAPDSTNRNRFFHNFYGTWQVSDKLGLTASFDYGVQQTQSGSSDYEQWHSITALLRYHLADQWWLAGRYENYIDQKGVIVPTGTANGFTISNYSVNLDFAPFENVWWRMEGRWFTSQDAIFSDKNIRSVSTNAVVSTALIVSF